MNLFDKFQSICENLEVIYYNHQLEIKDLFKNLTEDSAYKFIKDYFSRGGKSKVFDLNFSAQFKSEGKHIHTVSLYFLGFYLRGLFEEEIKRKLELTIPKWGKGWDYRFTYTWFLTCLYHDVATVKEEKKDTLFNGSSSDCLKYYFEKNSIKHDLYSHSWIYKHISPFTYSKTLIENYFLYRRNYCGTVDHGILGGFLQYDRLIKNYNQAWEKCEKNLDNKYESFKFGDINYLKWRIEHLDHFACIANAIIAHNIWHDDKSIPYKLYGLTNLVETEEYNHKIKFAEDPLTYFLGVVDTIEPIKFFLPLDMKYILRNINIKIINRSINIELLFNLPNVEEWFIKIHSLKNWLDIEVITIEANRKIQIIIN